MPQIIPRARKVPQIFVVLPSPITVAECTVAVDDNFRRVARCDISECLRRIGRWSDDVIFLFLILLRCHESRRLSVRPFLAHLNPSAKLNAATRSALDWLGRLGVVTFPFSVLTFVYLVADKTDAQHAVKKEQGPEDDQGRGGRQICEEGDPARDVQYVSRGKIPASFHSHLFLSLRLPFPSSARKNVFQFRSGDTPRVLYTFIMFCN